MTFAIENGEVNAAIVGTAAATTEAGITLQNSVVIGQNAQYISSVNSENKKK
jgi:hypothetical protein